MIIGCKRLGGLSIDVTQSRVHIVEVDKHRCPDPRRRHHRELQTQARTPSSFQVDGASTGFVNATASALPALPGNGDDFRGEALAVRDVDSDGWPDIVIGTTEVLADSGGAPLHSTRLFRGATGLKFTLDTVFLPSLSVDTGETTDILVLGDLSGRSDPSLLFLSTVVPAKSTNGDRLRVLDWNR